MERRDPKTQRDIDAIITACTCTGTVLDELTLLRISLRLYCEGFSAEDAVAQASAMLSDSLTKISSNDNGRPHKKP